MKGADSKMNQKTVGVGVLDNPHFEGNNQKGITLIALVITIIVLLILAGVTINMVLGDDGIIGQAQGASEAQKNAEEKQQYEINNAYKEILRTEKNLSGIGDISNDEKEVTLTKEGSVNNFENAIIQGCNTSVYTGNINEAKASANIIKLNKRVYTNKQIDNIDPEESLVIDLNGQELIYTGTTWLVNSIKGELYIIDTSKNKTGKIIMLNKFEEDKYNYQEKFDVNKDGIVCDYDKLLVIKAYGKNKTDPDWDQYKICDIDGRGSVNTTDYSMLNTSTSAYGHIIKDYTNVYTDVGEGAFISQCIHNK